MADAYPRPFGPYLLLKPLSDAESTPVFLTAVSGSEKPWALKVVLGSGATPAARQGMRAHARSLRRLSSPQVVEVLDAHESGDTLGLLMGYVDGVPAERLFAALASKGEEVGTGLAATIAREALRGLGDLHAFEGLELVHRNVSARTTMVSYDGRVRLVGFVPPSDPPSATSPGYSTAIAALDFRYDLRSVGKVLWEMLTRQRWTDRGTPATPPPSSVNASVQPSLDEVVAALLEGRFESAASASDAVTRAGGDWTESRTAELMRRLFAKDIDVQRDENARLLRAATGKFPKINGGTSPKVRYPEPGSFIGEYRLQAVIGEGGMGRVYRALHSETGTVVAIKLLHPHLRNPIVDQRFRREARAVAAIANPHIVTVTESGETPDGQFLFIAMEYLDGKSLDVLLTEAGPLPVDRALRIMIQVADAIDAAHGAGVIHRDIKPANIMLIRRGNDPDYVKVLDFGLARVEADVALTVANEMLGTTVYMAPEQARGQPATVKVDIYAVGEVLYEALTRKLPHKGDNAQELLVNKVKLDATPIEEIRADVPPALAAQIMRAIGRDPASRPESMRELRVALEACGSAARTQSRRIPAVVGALGLGIAVAVAIVLAVMRGGLGRQMPAVVPAAASQAPSASPVNAAGEAGAVVTHTVERPSRERAPEIDPAISAPPPLHPRPSDPAPTLPRAAITLPEARTRAAQTASRASPPRATVPADLPPHSEEPTAGQLLADAESAFERGERIQAVELAKRAERAGAGTRAHMALGKYYQRMHLLRDAAREFQAVLAIEPDNHLAKIGLETLPEETTPRHP